MFTAKKLFERRRQRTRAKLRKSNSDQPRLSVHRSSRHIYAQIIDDTAGATLAAASTLDADFKSESSKTADVAAAVQLVNLLQNAQRQGHKRGGI